MNILDMALPQKLTVISTILCDLEESSAAQAEDFKRKASIEGHVFIGKHGLSAVMPAARETHKDLDKAVHHYAHEHYLVWRALMSTHLELLSLPGAFSENFSSTGVTERDLCIGDIVRVGTAILQVTEGREACNTMVNRFHREGMDQEMHRTSRNGWFYRVLEEGSAQVGDDFILKERPNPEWTIARVQEVIFKGVLDRDVLQTVVALPGLARDWHELLLRRLETGVAEKAATGRPYL